MDAWSSNREKFIKMNAKQAAHNAGWYTFDYHHWFHYDMIGYLMHEKPLYFIGKAKDLCLGNGIDFDE